jgi:hypothetical protein
MTINITSLDCLKACTDRLVEEIPPVVSTDPRCYPFVGEKAVRARLEEDSSGDLRILVAVTMYYLQTEVEQATHETKDKNKRGLMSSHAAAASKTIKGLIAGVEPADDTEYRVDGFKFQGWKTFLGHIGGRYAKQTSKVLRSAAMASNPELAVTAQMFSVR